jgi:hypothetical protein
LSKNDFEDQLFGDLDLEDEEEGQSQSYSSKPLDITGIQSSQQEEIKRTLSRTQEFHIPSISSSPRLDVSNIPPPLPFWKRREFMIGAGVLAVLLLAGVVAAVMGVFSSPVKKNNGAGIAKRPKPVPAKHPVLLQTTPAGAAISIGGKAIGKVTPSRILLPTKGITRVVFKLKGYNPLEKKLDGKALYKAKTGLLKLVLNKEDLSKKVLRDAASVLPFGYLTLTCDPPKASVLIGSETKSACPITKMPLQVGETSIEVKADGFRPKHKTFTIKRGKITVLKVKLKKEKPKPKGSVEVTLVSIPSSVIYWYKGKKRIRLGPTPVTHTFPQGKQKLYLRNRRGLSMYYRLTVKGDKPFRRRIRFRKGIIKFFVKPWADVYINGKKYGQTPIKPVRLYQGRYRVELRLRKLRYKKRIYLNARRTYNFRHTFKRPRR